MNENLLATALGKAIHAVLFFNPDQPRDEKGQWTSGGEAANVGGVKVLDKQVSSASGSRYYHVTHNGEWYHARIADHENKTEQGAVKNLEATFRDSIAQKSGSGQTHPHELNIVVDKVPDSHEESKKIIEDVIARIGSPQRTVFPDKTVYGESVVARYKGGKKELEFLDR